MRILDRGVRPEGSAGSLVLVSALAAALVSLVLVSLVLVSLVLVSLVLVSLVLVSALAAARVPLVLVSLVLVSALAAARVPAFVAHGFWAPAVKGAPAALLAVALLGLPGCWPAAPDDWEPDRGEAVTRRRAADGDVFVKLKEGLARSLYEGLADGLGGEVEERCFDAPHCRRRAAQIVCSTENVDDPYVCELHLADGAWIAPRDDWELYHSPESNRRYGLAVWDGVTLTIDGDAGAALAAALGEGGGDEPVELEMELPAGVVAR